MGVGGAVAGDRFGPGGVSGGGGGPVGQGPVRPGGVIRAGEGIEQGLQLGEGGGLGLLGGEPFLHRLLEPLDFALGLGMVRLAVLLLHTQAAELVLQAIAATSAAGEPGGEHHPVVGQRRGRRPVGGHRGPERREHDRAGDPAVRGHRQRQPGVVIQPGQHLSCPVPSASG